MKIFFHLLLLTFTTQLFSQTKMLSMEDAVRGQRTYLAPKKLEQLGWIPGTDQYYYVEKDQLMIGSADKGKITQVLTLRQVNTAIRKAKWDTIKSLPEIKWLNSTDFRIEGKTSLVYNVKTNDISLSTGSAIKWANEDAAGADKSVNGSFAFTKGNNLFIQMDPNASFQITHDADKNIVNGQSVHREEWGISKGTFWSPQGNFLAFYRMDQTMVTDYPILDLTKQPASAEMIKYPMAGGKSHEVTVGVYDIKTAKTIFLKTGEPKDQYLINPCWTPDEKHIYITVLNRAQNLLKLNSYNAQNC
jgi:dipeptidyl-peptidase-4